LKIKRLKLSRILRTRTVRASLAKQLRI